MRKRVRKYADGGTVAAEAPPSPAAPPILEPELVQEDDDLSRAELPASAKAWLRQDKNSKYLYDENASARLADLHFKVVDEGHEAYSPAYWSRLEQRLEQPPASGDDVDQDAVDRVLAQARHSAPKLPKARDDDDGAIESKRRIYSAPPSREAPSSRTGTGYYADDPRRVTLTQEQKAAARMSGVDDVTYAKGLIELRRRKALGDYTGQP
jgi:hypothetical protein